MERKDDKAGGAGEGFALAYGAMNFCSTWEEGEYVAGVAFSVELCDGLAYLRL